MISNTTATCTTEIKDINNNAGFTTQGNEMPSQSANNIYWEKP